MRSRTILVSLSVLLLIAAACQPTAVVGTDTPESGVTPMEEATETPSAMETSTSEATSTTAPTEEMDTPTPEMTSTVEMTSTPSMTGTLTSEMMMTHGEEVYLDNCSACHGPDGEGTGNFPALAGNEDVTASDPIAITQFVVHGRSGTHDFGSELSDLDIAAVLTYIRNSWGNEATPVTVEDVESARQTPTQVPTPQ